MHHSNKLKVAFTLLNQLELPYVVSYAGFTGFAERKLFHFGSCECSEAGEKVSRVNKKSITILLSDSFCCGKTSGQISNEINSINKNVVSSVLSPRTECSYQ